MPPSTDPHAPSVLVADDEPALRDTIGFVLGREGFRVHYAASGDEAIRVARAVRPDLVVLDVLMPGLNGFQVCRALRAESTVPILLLSARSEEIDRVTGLDLGADDYLAKPFAMAELLARVRAMLRRAQMIVGVPPNEPLPNAAGDRSRAPDMTSPRPNGLPDAITVGDLSVDVARRYATLAGRRLNLKPKEFDLLHYLARHPAIVLSRDALLRQVWGYEYPIDTRTVDVHIRGLRLKIEDSPSQPRRIETVRGHGYRFVPDERA
ncbi:MAG: response regulator transcription factor [Chloroflexia bacterium]|nr:response regulator transcription factor [Chloroflexia bacterium]